MAGPAYDTFRLRGFPSDFTASSFASFCSDNSLEPVGNASLAPDATCSCSEQTATLTLRRESSRESEVPDSWGEVRLKIDKSMEAFTPLNDASSSKTYVDIVGVTGLAGRAFGSWQCGTGEMWLRDFLPRDIQNTRIHIYGYQSALQKSTSTAGLLFYTEAFTRLLKTYLEDTPTRHPLIMIGHSLGCLIIKQMLVSYRESSDYAVLLDRIYSIVLIGCPHRGLNTGALETLVGHSRREPLIKDLKYNSTLLESLRREFAKVSKTMKIITCYEMRETPSAVPKQGRPGEWERTGPPEMMVEPSSACLYTANELQIGIDKNHSEIGKLQDDWPAYQELKEALADHVHNAPRVISARHSQRDTINILDQISEIGRSLVPALLDRELQQPSQIIIGHVTPIVRLTSALEFFGHFRVFLKDEVSIAIFQRESLLVPSAQRVLRLISEIEIDFLKYKKFARNSQGRIWDQPGGALGRASDGVLKASMLDWSDPLLSDESINILSEKAVSCATRVRTETVFAMLGLQAEPVAEAVCRLPTAKTTGLATAAVRQCFTRRAWKIPSESVSSPLEGVLEHQDSRPGLKRGLYLSHAGEHGTDVIVEHRPYSQIIVGTSVNAAMKRMLEEQQRLDSQQLAHLCWVLEKITNVPDNDALHLSDCGLEPGLMRCLGYIDEPEAKLRQITYLFEIPRLRSGSSVNDITDLYSAITNKSALRHLEERFRIARALCHAVLNLHSWGWLHKDIRSHNVLLVPAFNSLDLFVPYLRGFEYARHSMDSTLLAPVHELEINLYRHPDRQGKPTIAFSKMHDLYAVGVVLYEIGTLRTVKTSLDPWLNKFFKQDVSPDRDAVAKEIKRRAAADLPMVMGLRFANAVRRCLESDFDVLHDDDVQTELSVRFRDMVLGPIEAGCHL